MWRKLWSHLHSYLNSPRIYLYTIVFHIWKKCTVVFHMSKYIIIYFIPLIGYSLLSPLTSPLSPPPPPFFKHPNFWKWSKTQTLRNFFGKQIRICWSFISLTPVLEDRHIMQHHHTFDAICDIACRLVTDFCMVHSWKLWNAAISCCITSHSPNSVCLNSAVDFNFVRIFLFSCWK